MRVGIGRRGYDESMDPRPPTTDFDGKPGMPDRFGRALRQGMVDVDAAVKSQPIAKLGLEAAAIHVLGVGLDGVEEVYAHFDEFGDEGIDGAVAVIHDFFAVGVGEVYEGGVQ